MTLYTPRPSDQERRVYALTMPAALYEEVRQAATDQDMTMAQWLRQAIRIQLNRKRRT